MTVQSPPTAAPPGVTLPARRGLTFSGLLRSEWIKLWSVRSLRRVLAAAVVSLVAVSAAATAGTVAVAGSSDSADPSEGGLGVLLSLSGASIATLLAAALGALVIAGEYSTGTLRTTLAVAPRRTQVLAAKAVVLAGVVTVVLGSAVLVAFLVGQAVLSQVGMDADATDPRIVRVVLGHVAVLTGVSLAGLGLGALTRSTPGALGGVVVLLFVLPLLTAALPTSAVTRLLSDYGFAGVTDTLTSVAGSTPPLAATALAFAAWVAVLLGAGALVLRRRDV